MDRDAELAVIRRAYAKQILAVSAVDNASVEVAFATVRRENFLGPGPWQVYRYPRRYMSTPSDDPVYLYTDDVVGIDPERHINNGEPSLHAFLLGAAAPAKGDHIVHIGAGTGYYTAIMAEMVGTSGRVTGIEFDPRLAVLARANLSSYQNVAIVEGDGAAIPFDEANVVYVNAGATSPANTWLDRLADGGRLILPLTTNKGFGEVEAAKMAQHGAVFRIKRRGDEYRAKWISPVAIFPCAGNRNESSEKALAAAFEKGGLLNVTRLYRNVSVPEERCWLRGDNWCLAFH